MTKKKKKTKEKNNNFKKTVIAVLIIIIVAISSFTAVYIFYPPAKPQKKRYTFIYPPKKTIKNKTPSVIVKKRNNIIFEVDTKTVTEQEKYEGIPKICIIIDDIGYDTKKALRLANIGIPITLSILPFTPHGKDILKKASNKNTEFMLHLPMEPKEFPSIDPGKGALLASMGPDAIIASLENDIDFIPQIKGINNHMGSKLTESSEIMNQVFSIIKKRNLFFIDSFTSSESKCFESAKLFKVRFAKRDVFLDNIQEEEFILEQLKKLKKTALQKGFAVGIGHPYKSTITAIEKIIPDFKKEVVFVKASSIVKNFN